jgi:hypothetical protein
VAAEPIEVALHKNRPVMSMVTILAQSIHGLQHSCVPWL